MTKLVIFDLDGTLLNTISDLGEACNYALGLHGFATHPLEQYPHLVGNGVNKLLERALPEGCKDQETVLRLKADFIPFYDAHNRVHTRPYDGIEDVIKSLKERGIHIAVASNKYQSATETLVKHYFGESFDVVFGEREGVNRKPDPQIVWDILSADGLCGITKSETLYVGDSDVDMQTARNAGLRSVACTWGFCSIETLSQQQPTYLIHHPLEILSVI